MRWRIFLALCLFIIVFGQSYETGRTGSHCDKMGAVFSGSFDQAFNYLTTTMDGFHNTFNVYTDIGAAGNHFSAFGMIPDETAAVNMDQCCTVNPRSGSTCIRCTFQPQGNNYGGYYFLNGTLKGDETEPTPNWGDEPNAGFDLCGATTITFYARGETGGEKVEFIVGGVGWAVDWNGNSTVPVEPYPDSFPKVRTGIITLTQQWTQYSINLQGKDLSYVLSGFGWVAAAGYNSQNITFYLDDIRWDKPRLEELRFLLSYETEPTQEDFEVVMRNAAFSYDNALALLAFLARGTGDDLNRAAVLADSFVHAIHHDRYYDGVWMRNAYMAGDLVQFPGWTPNGRQNTARMPGFWDCDDDSWYEDSFQVSIHTGNIGWVIIALLSSYQVLGNNDYLQAAQELAEWAATDFKDYRGSGGYTGGYEKWEPNPDFLLYKSTEHNLDLYVAFQRLYKITSDETWHQRAIHAKNFVQAMWDDVEGKFYTGTDNDGITINQDVIPLDPQTWAILAFRDEQDLYLMALDYAEVHHRVGEGFDFNTDQDGIWYEGSAQMAAAYNEVGEIAKAAAIITAIENAQFVNGVIPAASKDGLTTGFYLPDGLPWLYYQRGHVGASAWYLFAKLGVNPYWIGAGTSKTQPDFNGDGKADILWRYYGTGGYNAVWLRGTAATTASVSGISPVSCHTSNVGLKSNKKFYGGPGGGFSKEPPGRRRPLIDPFDFYMKKSKNGEAVSHTMASTVSDPRDDPEAVELSASVNTDWKLCGTGDFNGDNHVDLVWRNVSNGNNAVWFMDGVTMTGVGWLPATANLDWTLCGTGDFNGDGKPDLVWRNVCNGNNVVWYMDGVTMTGVGWLPTTVNLDWTLCGTGDFNNDGKTDLVWRNVSNGNNAVWFMDGVTMTEVGWLPTTVNLDWTLCGTGDFNNDGKVDLLWRNVGNGNNAIWYMDGLILIEVEFLTTVTDTTWKIEN